jgi:hypothetical protein
VRVEQAFAAAGLDYRVIGGLKDEAHLKDLDEAGLIAPEIEAGLSPLLRDRLSRTRARE